MATLPLPAKSSSDRLAAPELATDPQSEGLRSIPLHAVVAVGITVAGVFSIWPTALLLWALWTTDPLKSIGGFVPLVSLLLILRVWRALGWERQGTWWGLAILFATVAAVHLREHAILELVLAPSWSITLPPYSLVAFAYASGAVLLFGGVRLWRGAWFPVALMWLVNPVPHVFNRFVDLPLQHASAAVARGLAHALGQRLTPDQLYLMFTPDFGMFIAPGCNGIRGSITMGLIALIAGYLYQLRARRWALLVGAAVLLGYGFNLLRLCVLVLYYVLALHVPWLQGHAEMGDYLIGASLFFFATMLLFSAIRRWSPAGDLRLPPVWVGKAAEAPAMVGMDRRPGWRAASFAVLVAVGSAGYLRALVANKSPIQTEHARFPEAVGPYHLRRTWPEKLETGQTIFEWAEYGLPGAKAVVAVGISPVLGAHDTLLCHAARGEDWLWHGTLAWPTVNGPVNFSGSFFNDGATEYLEATTVCSAGSCGQWTSARTHFGLVYSRPDTRNLLQADPSRPIPVLLRAELPDASAPAEAARTQLTTELHDFAAQASFQDFTDRYGRP